MQDGDIYTLSTAASAVISGNFHKLKDLLYVLYFRLAIKSLQSLIYLRYLILNSHRPFEGTGWAIRNCGLILLQLIVDRLFETSESKTVRF